MQMLERAGEACIALADVIRTAGNEAHAQTEAESYLTSCGLPEEYAAALRWMAYRAINSAFSGNPRARMQSGVRPAVR